MRVVGYSTGALAPGDVPRALSLLAPLPAAAVELSALRLAELDPLLDALPRLDLGRYRYVSIHAPSRFSAIEEPAVAEAIAARVPDRFPIVLHPDTIHDPAVWRPLGKRLCIENMDRRKSLGRTLAELGRVFEQLPDASFCFDVGHAHQVDRTMTDAFFLVRALGARLCQVHVSEVTTRGRHDPVSRPAATAFRTVAAWIPPEVPILVEAPPAGPALGPGGITAQMEVAARALDFPGVPASH